MKTFKNIREGNKKIKGIAVSVQKKGSKHVAIIDGDKLDDFSSDKDAWSAIDQFMKNYRG